MNVIHLSIIIKKRERNTMNNGLEIRWHGRGGQGAKTAALLLADVAFKTGKYVQGFPEYGPERMGAPITAYNRISDTPVRVHSNIYTPPNTPLFFCLSKKRGKKDTSRRSALNAFRCLAKCYPHFIRTEKLPPPRANYLVLCSGVGYGSLM